jgi:major outer membrane protein
LKKLILALASSLSWTSLLALPLGNPADSSLYTNGLYCGRSTPGFCDPCYSVWQAFSFRAGFYGDYVFNRNMQWTGPDHSDFSAVELFTNAGYLALNVYETFDIFATLGATKISQYGDTSALLNNREGVINHNPAFSWSVGGRLTLLEYGCWTLGMEGQYFRTQNTIDSLLRLENAQRYYFNGSDNRSTYKEWQVGLAAAYTFTYNIECSALIPYLGVKWAGAQMDNNATVRIGTDNLSVPNSQSTKLWGLCVGLTALQNESFGVTVEGRFADESAIYVNGQMRF